MAEVKQCKVKHRREWFECKRFDMRLLEAVLFLVMMKSRV